MNNPSVSFISEGFLAARKITQKYAKTFYFASLFLPRNTRYASYAVYAVCRLSDDSVDEQSGDPKKALDLMQRNIDAAFSASQELPGPLFWAFRDTVVKYQIPKIYFEELLQGMASDLEKTRYENFADLYQYCYLAAGVVGLIMLRIFGHTQSQATEHAVNLGIAMQLTNILRDIKEDYARGRIYLPQQELVKFQLNETVLAQGRLDKEFTAFMKFQIRRSRQYYHDAMKGIELINGRRCRFVVYLMKSMYAAILKDIERHHYDVFSRRARVALPEKLLILLKVLLQGKFI